jgi:hydroxymethylpyrimidine/phosphomethylpyrimidine kinase
MKVALTIAGSDPSGGAGVQADLKTFHQHHVYGMSVVTLLTVQSTRGVTRVDCLDDALVTAQFTAITEDIAPQAAKTGALGSAKNVEAVALCVAGFTFPLVVDPVMVSKHGHALVHDDAIAAFTNRLVPHATLLAPNGPEATRLTGIAVTSVESATRAAQHLIERGARAVLVKGGHWGEPATDVLLDGQSTHVFSSPRIATAHTHGTGCTLSAAIAARLALGHSLLESVSLAKAFVTEAIRSAPGLGHGAGPLNHFVRVS